MGFLKKFLNKGGSTFPREKSASLSPVSSPSQPIHGLHPHSGNVRSGFDCHMGSAVKTAKVLRLLGGDDIEEQEFEIRSMVDDPLQQNLLHLLISDNSNQRVSTPELQGSVLSKDKRRKSESFLLPKREPSLVRFASETSVLSGRPVEERLTDPFYDSQSVSPTPSSHLSPRADSASASASVSASTSVWSPPEWSFASTPQPSPKAKNRHASPLASPRPDLGFVAHPLPTPPPTSTSTSTPARPRPRPGTPTPSPSPSPSPHLTLCKTFPLPSPVPLPLPLPPTQQVNSLFRNGRRDKNHAKTFGSFREGPIKSPLPSRCASPCASPNSRILSPKPSPFRSPCTSPRLSPAQSPTRLSQCPRKWQRGQELGRGSFGTVYEGMNLEDGSFVAVKVSHDEIVSPEIQQEIAILSQLQHPNIVRYLGTSIEEGTLCIFLELMKCSLQSLLRKYNHFEEDTIRSYTRQILFGLEYLHSKKRVHRDIKCSNILVDVNGQVKLADFGVAKEMNYIMASSVKGTPIYMAPEVIDPSPNRSYGFPADIWSLGCTVLEMADGKPPWSHLPAFGFIFKVSRGELPPIPEHLSPEAKDFILQCLKLKPQDRPSATELLQHRFVANAPVAAPFSTFGSPPRVPPNMLTPISVQPLREDNSVMETNLRSILNATLPKLSLSSPRSSCVGASEAQQMWHNLSTSSSDVELKARDDEFQRFLL